MTKKRLKKKSGAKLPPKKAYVPNPIKMVITDESPNFISFETAIYAIVIIFVLVVALLILCK